MPVSSIEASPIVTGHSKGYVQSLASLTWDADVVVLTNFDNSTHALEGKCSSPLLIKQESDSRTVKPKLVWPELESIFELDCRSRKLGRPIPTLVEVEGEGICTPSGCWG